jgi:3-oxoacyl-[acyl-carrier-protein] synthase II
MHIALGDAAGAIPVSSTKPATGHLLGAAGALELAIAVQTQRTGIAPPTLNLEAPDPDCDLDYIPLSARPVTASYAMSNSMGFGGHATSLIVRRWQERR